MPTEIHRKTLATKLKRRLLRLYARPHRRAKSQRPFKLGLVGLGGAAHWKLAEITACPDVTLHAVCDTRREAVDAVLQRYPVPHVFDDYRALVELSDLDGVILATPNAMHQPVTVAALSAGKHVLCEKPLAMDSDEARQMVEAARRAKRRALVHFPYRLSAEARFAGRLIAEGRLGSPYHLAIVYAHGGWYAEDGSLRDAPGVGGWRQNRALAGSGVLSDLGSHALDLARYWLGEAESIDATLLHQGGVARMARAPGLGFRVSGLKSGTPEREPRTPNSEARDSAGGMDGLPALAEDEGIDDTASYRVRYRCGALGTFVNSRCYTGCGQHFVAELYGSRAALRFQPGRLHWYETATDHWIEVAVPDHFGRTMINEFVAAMLGKEVGAASFDDGFHVQQLLDAALESDARRCEVWVGNDRTGETENPIADSITGSLAHSAQ